MSIDEARAFLVNFMNWRFEDKTFGDYINTTLAGDFAVELVTVLEAIGQRLADAEDDNQRLHDEKVKEYLRAVKAEAIISGLREEIKELRGERNEWVVKAGERLNTINSLKRDREERLATADQKLAVANRKSAADKEQFAAELAETKQQLAGANRRIAELEDRLEAATKGVWHQDELDAAKHRAGETACALGICESAKSLKKAEAVAASTQEALALALSYLSRMGNHTALIQEVEVIVCGTAPGPLRWKIIELETELERLRTELVTAKSDLDIQIERQSKMVSRADYEADVAAAGWRACKRVLDVLATLPKFYVQRYCVQGRESAALEESEVSGKYYRISDVSEAVAKIASSATTKTATTP